MPSKFLSALRLARLHVPASYLLPFVIASLGGVLGSSNLVDLRLLPLFFIGSTTARGAGCIINDIFDKDFDSYVERTKNRPLASGAVSLKFAYTQLFIFAAASLIILFVLPPVAIYTSIIAAIMTVLYPLMKRITNLPQVFLGFTYSIASLIGYATVTNDISPSAILLYLAVTSWTIGFDVIYGFMDVEYDKKIKVKSMAIWLEHKNYKLWISSLYIIFITIFCISYRIASSQFSLVFYLSVICSSYLLFWQVRTLDITIAQNCLIRFRSNIYVGAVLLFGSLSTRIYF